MPDLNPNQDQNQDQGIETATNNSNFEEQVHSNSPLEYKNKFSKKTLIIAIIVFLFILTGVFLFYFTDWRYKIPFFRPNTSQLISKFYKQLAELDGADFALSYRVNVGSRDADVVQEVGLEEEKEEELEEGLLSFSPQYDFLSGAAMKDSWMFMEDIIPDNLAAEITFTGSGFSLSQREKEKQNLPDLALGLKGNAKMASASFLLDIEARIVNDRVFYMVSDFPFIDISKGNMKKWIKISPENDNDYLNMGTIEYDDNQKKVVESFKRFVSQTEQYDILSFKPSGNIVDVKGKKSLVFDVEIKAENVPTWLEEAQKIAVESGLGEDDDSFFFEAKKENLSEEEKQKIVDQVKEMMTNTKIKVAIDMKEVQLTFVEIAARYIPPPQSEKFKDKQFNFTINLELSNHNKPAQIKAPDVYIDQETIEQQDLGMTDEQFLDYKQAKRIVNIRKELVKYYKKNHKFPTELSAVTRFYMDRNTGQLYSYSVSGNNYSLTYKMNINVKELLVEPPKNAWGVDELPSDVFLGSKGSDPESMLKNVFYNNILYRDPILWHDGENTADRFSPIADQSHNDSQYIKEEFQDKYSNQDFLQAYFQSSIIKEIRERLRRYHNDNNKYPDSIADLTTSAGYFSNDYGFICEDLNTGKQCDYSVIDDGRDYQIKISFPMHSVAISEKVSLNSFSFETVFSQGENIFSSTGLIVDKAVSGIDSDNDGLLDIEEIYVYGTDPFNPDSDGDGYLDGEEVAGGYNPLGAGKLEELVWIRGDRNARVSLVVFSDLNCAFCKRHHENVKQIIKEYNGKVNWVHYHFSVLGSESATKAEATECVGSLGEEDKFWQYLDKLYMEGGNLDTFSDQAVAIGINKNQFDSCLASGKYSLKVQNNIQHAQKSGASSTPFSIIVARDQNETKIINGALPISTIRQYLDSFLMLQGTNLNFNI